MENQVIAFPLYGAGDGRLTVHARVRKQTSRHCKHRGTHNRISSLKWQNLFSQISLIIQPPVHLHHMLTKPLRTLSRINPPLYADRIASLLTGFQARQIPILMLGSTYPAPCPIICFLASKLQRRCMMTTMAESCLWNRNL